MKLLGIDTATTATAVALRLGHGECFEARDDPPAGARPGHTAELLPLAAGLLARGGVGWGELDAIAVGLGPGTFTGLRVGVASARALAQSLGVDVIGVGSLAALALPALEDCLSAGAPARVLSVLDARRGEAFIGAYALREPAGTADIVPADTVDIVSADTVDIVPASATAAATELALVRASHVGGAAELALVRASHVGGAAELALVPASSDGGGAAELALVPASSDGGGAAELALVELLAPRPVRPERIAEELAELLRTIGESAQDWLAVGDGARLFAGQLEAAGARVAPAESPLHRISAAAVCELAHAGAGAREQVRDGRAQVLPEYGRRPDAELTLEGAAR